MMSDSVEYTDKYTRIKDVRKPVKKINISLGKNAEDIIYLANDIKEPNTNYRISEIKFKLDSRTKPDHIQLLFAAIEQYNNNNNHTRIEKLTLEFKLERDLPLSGSLAKLHGLRSPTKYFQLDQSFVGYWPKLFPEIVSCLQNGTNFNQFSFSDMSLFVDDEQTEGFKEFCQYFTEHNDRLVCLEMADLNCIGDSALPHLVQLIKKSTALTQLSFSVNHSKLDIFEALTNSTVKVLDMELLLSNTDLHTAVGRLIGNSTALEELHLRRVKEDMLTNLDFKSGLKTTQSLRKFFLYFLPKDLADLSILEENESIIECDVNGGFTSFSTEIKALTLRNRKLQNERVKSTIVLLYNIVRFNHCRNLSNESVPILPSDIWELILSQVKYPGVTLDFGSIARALFNDSSIRRVIGILSTN